MKCPKCGAENPEDSNYCQECGSKISYEVSISSIKIKEGNVHGSIDFDVTISDIEILAGKKLNLSIYPHFIFGMDQDWERDEFPNHGKIKNIKKEDFWEVNFDSLCEDLPEHHPSVENYFWRRGANLCTYGGVDLSASDLKNGTFSAHMDDFREISGLIEGNNRYGVEVVLWDLSNGEALASAKVDFFVDAKIVKHLFGKDEEIFSLKFPNKFVD